MGDENKIAFKVVKIANAARRGLAGGIRAISKDKMLELREKAFREGKPLADVFKSKTGSGAVKTVTATELRALKVKADADGVSVGKAVKAALDSGEPIDTSALDKEEVVTAETEEPKEEVAVPAPSVEEVAELAEEDSEPVENEPADEVPDTEEEELMEPVINELEAEKAAVDELKILEFTEFASVRTLPELRSFARDSKIPISATRKSDIVDELALDILKKFESYDSFYAFFKK